MTWKIERSDARRRAIIRLSGRLQAEHLDELKLQIMGDRSRISLDLEGVTLLDVEVVRLLNACEASGVALLHCGRYIREWMLHEKDREG